MVIASEARQSRSWISNQHKTTRSLHKIGSRWQIRPPAYNNRKSNFSQPMVIASGAKQTRSWVCAWFCHLGKVKRNCEIASQNRFAMTNSSVALRSRWRAYNILFCRERIRVIFLHPFRSDFSARMRCDYPCLRRFCFIVIASGAKQTRSWT